ncbi:MAG: hypothetical protein WC913_06550 [Desulfuromonas sp.]
MWTRFYLEWLAHGGLVYAGIVYVDNFRSRYLAVVQASTSTSHINVKLPELFRQNPCKLFPVPALRRNTEA